jgi:hypothetical protein
VPGAGTVLTPLVRLHTDAWHVASLSSRTLTLQKAATCLRHHPMQQSPGQRSPACALSELVATFDLGFRIELGVGEVGEVAHGAMTLRLAVFAS